MSDVDERRRASDPRLRQAIARLTSRWVTVRYGKRGRTRAIPLEEDALAAIAAWVKARPAAASECCCRCRAPGQPPRALTTRDVARYAQAAGLPEDRRTCCAPRSAPASPTRAPSVGGRLDLRVSGWAGSVSPSIRPRVEGGRMRRLMTLTAGFALVAVLLTGCGGDGDNGETTTASPPATTATTPTATPQEAVPAVVKVSIGDNFYKPKDLTIKRGQSISWRNAGAVAHTVTSDTDSSVKFDSGTLNPGSVYALKPSTVGEITYYCTIHGKVQSGTITVTR